MTPLTEPELRACLVNATRGEASRMSVPLDLDDVDWSRLDFLGWRDRKIPTRGYIIRQTADAVTGLMLRAAEARMSPRRSAMCLLCRAVDKANRISLFTTRKTGAAGRNGDTVGTYICAGLDCSSQLRAPSRSAGRMMADAHKSVDQQALDMLQRLDAFIASIQ